MPRNRGPRINVAAQAAAPAPAAAPPTQVGVMYARWTLDCVVEAAIAVSLDYEKRYMNYRNVDPAVAPILSSFRSRTGADPDWPNAAQRSAIFLPLLGPCDAKPASDRKSAIQEAGWALRQAATKYAERVYDTGEPMLLQAFLDAARNFKACLTTLSGSVVTVGERRSRVIFDNSVRVLSSNTISQAFGIPPAPGGTWPIDGQLDGNGAYLIEEITRTVQMPPLEKVSQGHFLSLQRIAFYGAEVMAQIEADWHLPLNNALYPRIIISAYAWTTALRSLTKQ